MESEQIEAAWQKVLEDWDDDDAHKRFIVLCESFNILHEAGSRYRAIRESEPERGDQAKKQIDRILVSAMSKLSVERSEPQKRPPRAVWILAVVLFLALLGFAGWAMTRM